MEDAVCEEEVECVTQYVVLLLGVDDDPIPSMIHLNNELFVLTESIPALKGFIKFSASPNGPRCETIYECLTRYSGSVYNYAKATSEPAGWFILDGRIRLTAEGKEAFNKYHARLRKKNPSYFDKQVSALELIRIFYDDFTQDELLLLLSDYHKEYFTSLTDDKEYIKNKEKISLHLLERDLITESRYQELVGHPVVQQSGNC